VRESIAAELILIVSNTFDMDAATLAIQIQSPKTIISKNIFNNARIAIRSEVDSSGDSLTYLKNVRITDNILDNSLIRFYLSIVCTDVIIADNIMTNTTGLSAIDSQDTASSIILIDGIVIKGNDISTCGEYGIILGGKNMRIEGNNIEDVQLNGIHLLAGSTKSIIKNNRVKNWGLSNTGGPAGIYVITSDFVTVYDNILEITDDVTALAYYGISLHADCDNAFADGNRLLKETTRSYTVGIRLAGTDIVAINNDVRGVSTTQIEIPGGATVSQVSQNYI
jgi:hypothetical protein